MPLILNLSFDELVIVQLKLKLIRICLALDSVSHSSLPIRVEYNSTKLKECEILSYASFSTKN